MGSAGAGTTNHATGEYGPLFFLIEGMDISLCKLAHKSDEPVFH